MYCYRPALRGALGGCLHLLRCVDLDADTARELATSLLRELHVPSLGAAERLLSLQCLEELARLHSDAAAALGAPLLEGVIAAVDGEKDPRCLAVAFALWPLLADVFPPTSAPMAACAEDLHDIVSCYFPLSFSGSVGRGAAGAPDRGALASALASAMSASPAFAPFVLPLVLGKLAVPGDAGETAVLDALDVLGCCTRAFPAALLAPHAVSAWRALRGLILPAPPAAGEAIPILSGAVRLRARRELTLLLRALGAAPSCGAARELVATAVNDEFVSRALLLLTGGGGGVGGGEMEQGRLARTLAALSALLCSIAAASIDSARAVSLAVLPAVFASAPLPRMALRLAVHHAVAAAQAAVHSQLAAGAAGFSLGSPLADAAPQLLSIFLGASAGGDGDEAAGADWDWEEASQEVGLEAEQAALRQPDLPRSLLGVAGISALLRLPPACAALCDGQADAAASGLVAAVLQPDPGQADLAAASLAVLAQRDNARNLVARVALPVLLLAAAGSGASAAAALRSLELLARAAPAQLGIPACQALSASLQADLAQDAAVNGDTAMRLHALTSLFDLLQGAGAHAASPFAHAALLRQVACGDAKVEAALSLCTVSAAAACDSEQQVCMVRVAAEQLAFQKPPARAALAVVSALRPGPAVEACQPQTLLACLIAYTCLPVGAALEEVLDAVASLANKAHDGEGHARAALEAAGVQATLRLAVEEASAVDCAALASCCVACAALCAGLAPRGSVLAVEELPALLLPLLRLPPASHPGVAAAAAAALGGALLRSPLPHAFRRALWQQRYFATLLVRVHDSLRGALGDSRIGGLLALAHLLRGAPRIALIHAGSTLSMLLPECLMALLVLPGGDDELLSGAATAMGELLCEGEGRLALADNAGPLLRALAAVALACPRASAEVRLTALQAITACATLPYAKTFPHRRRLLRDLAAATDDARRAVRAAAVAARIVWAALPDA